MAKRMIPLILILLLILSGCSWSKPAATGSANNNNNHIGNGNHSNEEPGTPDTSNPDEETTAPPDEPSPSNEGEAGANTGENGGEEPDGSAIPVQETAGTTGDLMVVANPDSIVVMVNKQYALPEDYEPDDLVYPDVPFIFSEMIDKRKMRAEAATALEKLFAAAEEDGVYLAGVSGYRSYARQKTLFEQYVKRDGEEAARMYSAYPGTSEHQTGFSIDISGTDGKCAAESCFEGTPEALWLADHAWEHGYVIRYPADKVEITGYKYEPWHIRYVGEELARELHERGIVLEEYYDAVEVSGKQ